MGSKRSIFGNLQLWSHARSATPAEERGNPVDVVAGVDQLTSLHVPASPNTTGGIEVVTWGGRNPAAKTQSGFLALRAAIKAAVRARMPYGLPLVWNEDDALDRVLASGAATTYVLSAPHAFSVADLLYFFRPTTAVDRASLHLFGWAAVESIPDATSVVLAEDPTTDDYSPEAGDLVVRASSLWSPLYAVGSPQFARPKTGDHYSPEVTWRFVGVPSVELHAAAADLTSLPT